MKKKSPRGIPDFSRKTAGKPGAPSAADKSKSGTRGATPPRPKPQSTSAKGGQRGT